MESCTEYREFGVYLCRKKVYVWSIRCRKDLLGHTFVQGPLLYVGITVPLDSASAIVFSSPGMWIAYRVVSFSMNQRLKSQVRRHS